MAGDFWYRNVRLRIHTLINSIVSIRLLLLDADDDDDAIVGVDIFLRLIYFVWIHHFDKNMKMKKESKKKCVEKYNGSVNIICRLSLSNRLSHSHPSNDMEHSSMDPLWNRRSALSILVAWTEKKTATRPTVYFVLSLVRFEEFQGASESEYATNFSKWIWLGTGRNSRLQMFYVTEERRKLPRDWGQKIENTLWWAGSEEQGNFYLHGYAIDSHYFFAPDLSAVFAVLKFCVRSNTASANSY